MVCLCAVPCGAFCFLKKEAPDFLKHGFPVRSSLRGFLFSEKRGPCFFKAWFACDQLPPGVYFLEKRHLTFLEAWFSCDKRPPGVYFLKKRPPKSSQSCPRLANSCQEPRIPPRLSPDVFSTFSGMSRTE